MFPPIPDHSFPMSPFSLLIRINKKSSFSFSAKLSVKRPTSPHHGDLTMTSLFILFVPLLLLTPAASSSCPTNFAYVKKSRWDDSSCRNNSTVCCQSLRSLIGVAVAQYLKQSSNFEFPDEPSAAACLADFQHAVSEFYAVLPAEVRRCLKTSEYTMNRSHCAGIQTLSDWRTHLGNSTEIDSACKGDLSDLPTCNLCRKAGQAVTSRLAEINNTSDSLKCWYFVCDYATGIVNELGPTDPRTTSCTFSLPFDTPRDNDNTLLLVFAATGSAGVAALVLAAVVWMLCVRRRQQRMAEEREFLRKRRKAVEAAAGWGRNTGAIWYKLKEIEKATGKFNSKNLVGQGAFGAVYKGTLPDGREIAVKRVLDDGDGSDAEFANEMEIINSIRHRNLVALRGCCIGRAEDGGGGHKFLIYDYYPNGSLARHLFGSEAKTRPLTWPQRRRIILGTAKALQYLHEGLRPAIFHRDVKTTNILLDNDFNALVTDFGLARIVRPDRDDLASASASVTTRVAGTHGYLAPEYALYGQLSDKADVYSFGVVLLEVMSARPALWEKSEDAADFLITDWAWRLLKADKGMQVLDPAIRESGCEGVMMRFVSVGVLCAHVMVAFRPSMAEAVKMLQGDIEIPMIPDRPMPLALPPFGVMTSSFLSVDSGPTQRSSSPTHLLR